MYLFKLIFWMVWWYLFNIFNIERFVSCEYSFKFSISMDANALSFLIILYNILFVIVVVCWLRLSVCYIVGFWIVVWNCLLMSESVSNFFGDGVSIRRKMSCRVFSLMLFNVIIVCDFCCMNDKYVNIVVIVGLLLLIVWSCL